MEQQLILSRLLDKYENSVHLTHPGVSHRRVMLQIARKELPEYQYETAQVRDRFNQSAQELARAGLVQLEWVPGRPVLSKIILNLSNVQRAYQKTGRKHPREKAQHVCAILRQALAGVRLPWIAAFRDETCVAIEHTWKIPALFRQGDAFLEGLMHAFKCYDDLCGGTITARAFSTQCFQNSKRFEREFQEPFLKIAARFQPELAEISEHQTLSDKEMLALLGIYSHPELYPLSGRCSIVTTGGVVDLAPLFPNGIALPSTAVESITSFSLEQIHRVTFIENKTNYEEYLFAELAADELAIFHGGFLSPQKRLFFKKMAEFMRDKTEIVFWADIDLGGFQMFSRLQQIFPQLQPMRMRAEDVDRYAQYGLRRDDSYLGRLQTAFETGEFPMFQDAIQEILRYRVTIEQEVFLTNESYRKRSQK